ncbi:hypothetical protein BXZ70DRAFT_932631 [Cristinia sonorae]|uniref:F-box domain-containing protein n=1 Tax=Cristinia sonorae TaxID=1940300 RepID=A0A8K0URV3_9AGAR|nr:hypothetical protein BXZ70DRAFT_932631 [Cristinia sonorae]
MSEKDSANPPQFPQEMVENFTSFLWDDPKSISHCSLVSHRWYSAVRPFIYRRIVLESKERLTRFEHLLLGDPAIGYWVRELHIVGGHRYYKTYSFWPEIFVSPGSGTFFPGRVLPEKLKKLYALTFECVYTSSVGASAHSIRAVSSAFASTVRSLTFMSCLGHEGFFLAFAHAFPNLNELRLMKVATKPLLHGTPLADDPDRSLAQFQEEVIPFMPLCLTQGNPTAEYDHPQTFITSLRIDHPDFVQDCESLFCTKSLRTVQALEIRHSGSRLHPIDDISNKILPECGRALRSLKLTIASLPEPEEIVR